MSDPRANSLEVPARNERLRLFVALGVLVSLPYFFLSHHPTFPPMIVPETAVDHFIPFAPWAIWFYLSLYVQLTLPLLLARNSRELRLMSFGFAWIAIVSHSIFLVWPTAVLPVISRPQLTDPLFKLVLAVDTNLNALPSLHASLAIYCALCASRMLKDAKRRAGLWLWTFAIVGATLLAKRHVFLDVCGGAALSFAAYFALFRSRPMEFPDSEALRATLQARANLASGAGPELNSLLSFEWRKRAIEFLLFASLGMCGVWLTLASPAAYRFVAVPAGVIATALALNAFVLLMHDGMHDSLLPDRRWNRAGSVLLGATFLMSFSAYRVLHARHHKYLGDPRDPDDYQNYTRRRSLVWVLHFVRLSFGSLLYLAFIPILALKHATDVERRRILAEYAFLLVVYSLTLRFIALHTLFIAWFVPLLIVGTLTAIRGFTQHGITEARDPYIASRTILPNPIVGFFLLHENYHLEHHLFPEVPSYHLPGLHRLIWPKLPRAVSGRGYLRFLFQFLRAAPRRDETPIGLEIRAPKSA